MSKDPRPTGPERRIRLNPTAGKGNALSIDEGEMAVEHAPLRAFHVGEDLGKHRRGVACVLDDALHPQITGEVASPSHLLQHDPTGRRLDRLVVGVELPLNASHLRSRDVGEQGEAARLAATKRRVGVGEAKILECRSLNVRGVRTEESSTGPEEPTDDLDEFCSSGAPPVLNLSVDDGVLVEQRVDSHRGRIHAKGRLPERNAVRHRDRLPVGPRPLPARIRCPHADEVRSAGCPCRVRSDVLEVPFKHVDLTRRGAYVHFKMRGAVSASGRLPSNRHQGARRANGQAANRARTARACKPVDLVVSLNRRGAGQSAPENDGREDHGGGNSTAKNVAFSQRVLLPVDVRLGRTQGPAPCPVRPTYRHSAPPVVGQLDGAARANTRTNFPGDLHGPGFGPDGTDEVGSLAEQGEGSQVAGERSRIGHAARDTAFAAIAWTGNQPVRTVGEPPCGAEPQSRPLAPSRTRSTCPRQLDIRPSLGAG